MAKFMLMLLDGPGAGKRSVAPSDFRKTVRLNFIDPAFPPLSAIPWPPLPSPTLIPIVGANYRMRDQESGLMLCDD
jgi:hypothetical protein